MSARSGFSRRAFLRGASGAALALPLLNDMPRRVRPDGDGVPQAPHRRVHAQRHDPVGVGVDGQRRDASSRARSSSRSSRRATRTTSSSSRTSTTCRPPTARAATRTAWASAACSRASSCSRAASSSRAAASPGSSAAAAAGRAASRSISSSRTASARRRSSCRSTSPSSACRAASGRACRTATSTCPVTPMDDPSVAFDRIFADVGTSTSALAAPDGAPQERARRHQPALHGARGEALGGRQGQGRRAPRGAARHREPARQPCSR